MEKDQNDPISSTMINTMKKDIDILAKGGLLDDGVFLKKKTEGERKIKPVLSEKTPEEKKEESVKIEIEKKKEELQKRKEEERQKIEEEEEEKKKEELQKRKEALKKTEGERNELRNLEREIEKEAEIKGKNKEDVLKQRKIKLEEKIQNILALKKPVIAKINELILQKESIEENISVILEQEKEIENQARQIEDEEKREEDKDLLKAIKERRWETEEKRKEIELKRWKEEEGIQKINNEIKGLEESSLSIGKDNKEEQIKEEIKKIEKIENKAKIEEERSILQKNLDIIFSQERELDVKEYNLEKKKIVLLNLLSKISEEEKNINLEKEKTEEEEKSESNPQKKRDIEKKRWEIENKRRTIEKKAWDAERAIKAIEEQISDINKKKRELEERRNLGKRRISEIDSILEESFVSSDFSNEISADENLVYQYIRENSQNVEEDIKKAKIDKGFFNFISSKLKKDSNKEEEKEQSAGERIVYQYIRENSQNVEEDIKKAKIDKGFFNFILKKSQK